MGERGHRANAVRPPVQALEEHRPRCHGTRGREAKDADGKADLSGRVGHLAGTPVEVALELEDKHAIDFPPEVRGKETARLRPRGGQLAGCSGTDAHAPAELDLTAGR